MTRLKSILNGTALILALVGTGAANGAVSAAARRTEPLAVRQVRAGLQAHHLLEGIHVQSAPGMPGEVILSGRIRSVLRKNQVFEQAWRAPAVKRLVDHIRIEPNRSTLDDALEARIYSVINADPDIGVNDTFEVNVDDGVADIGGIVESWRAHHRFTHDAFVAGARTVVNHLRVRQDPSGSERRFVYTRDPQRGRGAS